MKSQIRKRRSCLTIHLTEMIPQRSHLCCTVMTEAPVLAEADGEPVSLVDRSRAMDVVEAVYAIVLK